MSDLAAEMERLAERLKPASGKLGRCVQFVGSRSGDGVSSFARAFALAAARSARRGVWLIELDLFSQHQVDVIEEGAARFGALGAPVSASPDGSSFFQVKPTPRQSEEALLVGYPVGALKLWVTRFRAERLDPGASVEIAPHDLYWRAMRRHADFVVVDAPALQRSSDALKIARHMDANLVVLDSVRADAEADALLVETLRRAGGVVAGALLNRAPDHLIEDVVA